jgi:hypothetical protein
VAYPNLCSAVAISASCTCVVDGNLIDLHRRAIAADGHRIGGRRSWAYADGRSGGAGRPEIGQGPVNPVVFAAIVAQLV